MIGLGAQLRWLVQSFTITRQNALWRGASEAEANLRGFLALCVSLTISAAVAGAIWLFFWWLGGA